MDGSSKTPILNFEIYELRGLEEQFFGVFSLKQNMIQRDYRNVKVAIERQESFLGEAEIKFKCLSKRELIQEAL